MRSARRALLTQLGAIGAAANAQTGSPKLDRYGGFNHPNKDYLKQSYNIDSF